VKPRTIMRAIELYPADDISTVAVGLVFSASPREWALVFSINCPEVTFSE